MPQIQGSGLPFLFSDYRHVYKVLDGEIGEELLDGLEAYNMVQLAYWENGLRQMTNSQRAIETPSDLAGLKFRTPEDAMTVSIFAAYGAEASPYPFSELYLALQQKTFDGQENPVANIYANRFQDVQQYLTIVNYQYQPKNMLFSLSAWNRFPAEIQKILREAAREFGNEHRQAIVDSEEAMLRELIADSMAVGYPDTAPFIEQAETVYRDFYEENEWAEDLVARIRAAETE
ncbi:MAG: TRAP transporter substrate-binding protein [Oscillibacter sp.]|nr:TRAP transporter substrate-binding protein [Oscillibacter sp.]